MIPRSAYLVDGRYRCIFTAATFRRLRPAQAPDMPPARASVEADSRAGPGRESLTGAERPISGNR